jgi:hypothetical protein
MKIADITGRRALPVVLCALMALCGVLLTSIDSVHAQERTGTITGQLTDPQGGVLPGVNIVLTNRQTGRVTTFQSDGSGRYVANVDPGIYSVRFELAGFAPQERQEVEVLLGRTFEINTTMRVGGVAEAVQVTAETSPLVDTRSTMIAHNVTAEEIDRMPKGRSFQSVAMTAPSVNQGDIEGGIQVNGASGSENQYTIDGVSTNSLLGGQSRQNTVFEYLQEVQVKTVGIPAEYGGALGGVVSAVTKSGGNRFTGEGHYYFSGSALNAGPVKRLNLDPVDDVTTRYIQDEEDPSNNNEVGGSIGGPIVRDRLFFFGSVSPRFTRRTSSYLFRNGLEASDVTREQTFMNAYGKVSYGGRRFNAYFGALFTPTKSGGTLLAYNVSGPNFNSTSLASYEPNRVRGYKTDQRNLTANVDINVSNTTYVSVKVGSFYDNYKDTGVPTTTPVRYRTSNTSMSGIPANLVGGVLFGNTPAVQIVEKDATTQTYMQADYNAAFSAAGFHTLKVGAGMRHNANDVNQRYPGGLVDVYWDSSFTSSVPGVGTNRGVYGYYEVNDNGTVGKADANISHFYVQDQWSVGRLTMNLGLRLEDEKIPAFRERDVAIEFGWKDKVAPRVGAAYDVFGDGRMKLFGSYGRYYDWTKYELARGTFGGDIWLVWYRTLDDPSQVFNLSMTNMPGRDIWGSASGVRDRRVPAFGPEQLDPDLKPMSQDSYSGGFEYQLGASSVLAVNYVRNHLIRTIEDVGQLVDGDEVYIYGNPGEGITKQAFISTQTSPFLVPKPVRQYDALQVSLNRRFSNNWFLGGNYTLSRLYGNYAGIASSDEIRTPAEGLVYGFDQQQSGEYFRPGGNANRGFDLDEMMWDAHGNLDPKGRLATDRPHVLKLYGAYMFPFGTQIGVNSYTGSGTPLTTYVTTINGTEVFVEGRGDMGRTPVLNYTDVLLSHEVNIGGAADRRVRFELNVLNVFNQKTARHVYNKLNRARSAAEVNLGPLNLANGYDYNALIANTADGRRGLALDPRYGQEDLFNDGTRAHFMVKFLF